MHPTTPRLLAVLLLTLPCTAQAAPNDPPGPAAPSARDAVDVLELSAGARALGAGDPEGALELLLPYVERHPDSALARFLAGVSLYELGELSAAREQLGESVRLDDTDTTAQVVLARVLRDLGEPEAGLELLRRVVELEPEDSRHWTSLGMACFEAERLVEAHAALIQAVRLDGAALSAHIGLGRILSLVGEAESASRSYRTAAELAPDDPALAVTLGHVLRDAGRPEEALESYRHAADLDPSDPWIEANLGSTLLELDQPARARRLLESALARLPPGPGFDMGLVHLHHGESLLRLGDLEGAGEAFVAAVGCDPTLGRAQRALGELLLDRDQFEGARWHLDAALALDCLPGDLLVELTLLHERSGDDGAARRCAQVLFERVDGDLEGALQRAVLRLRSDQPGVADRRAAADELRRLLAGPLAEHAGTWALLGEALADGGEAEAARRALQRSRQLSEAALVDPEQR